MKNKSMILIAVCLCAIVFLSGCTEEEVVEEDKKGLDRFVGGTEGIVGTFSYPDILYEGQPFDIAFSVENKGETEVAVNMLKVYLSGVKWSSYSANGTENYLATSNLLIDENGMSLTSVEKSPTGEAILGGTDELMFSNLTLSAPNDTQGQTVNFGVTMCYPYKTIGAAQVCIGKVDVGGERAGQCVPTGEKEVDSSGGPVQVTKVEETTSGTTEVTHTFRIYFENVGEGQPYTVDLGTDNCVTGLTAPNKGKVKIESISLDGIDISNEANCKLSGTDRRLSAEKGMISCRYSGGSGAAGTELLEVVLSYDYYDSSIVQEYTIQGF